MKYIRQYKWMIFFSPVAALGVCMYAFYVGFTWLDTFPRAIEELLMVPGWHFIHFFPEGVSGLVFGYVLDYGAVSVGEVVGLYLIYRIILGMITGRVTMESERKQVLYVLYAILLWLPFWVGFMTFMNVGE